MISDTVEASREYDQETSFLTKLAELNHHAVTIPIAMWRQGKQCCMLFPLAQSNLKVYLRETPRPMLTKEFVLGLISQIICLADALHSIHYVKPSDLIAPGATESLSPDTASAQRHRTGYHHDLKPENILIFRGKSEPHIWKIADFGTARIHSAVSGGRSHLERHLTAGDPDYSAPDWNIPELKATSRPYDIWSFGCILLEVLIWIFDQSPGRLEQFMADRIRDAHKYAAFWTKRGDQIVHCPSVLQRLETLRQETRDFAPFGKLVDVATAALKIDPRERPDALRLLGELEIIQMQVRLNLRVNPDFYTSAGNPQIPFASFPSTMLDDSNSNDSRSLELAILRRPSAPNLQVPDSPHIPRPRSASVDSRRSRRSTDSAVGRQRSDITGMGALMQDPPTPPQHVRSQSNPQIVLNNDASALT
jgi:serine/threonine protein kinase